MRAYQMWNIQDIMVTWLRKKKVKTGTYVWLLAWKSPKKSLFISDQSAGRAVQIVCLKTSKVYVDINFDGHAHIWKTWAHCWGRCQSCFVDCSWNLHKLGSLTFDCVNRNVVNVNSTFFFSSDFSKHKLSLFLRSTNYELALLIGNCLEQVNIVRSNHNILVMRLAVDFSPHTESWLWIKLQP